jgi:hypothetical protein
MSRFLQAFWTAKRCFIDIRSANERAGLSQLPACDNGADQMRTSRFNTPMIA